MTRQYWCAGQWGAARGGPEGWSPKDFRLEIPCNSPGCSFPDRDPDSPVPRPSLPPEDFVRVRGWGSRSYRGALMLPPCLSLGWAGAGPLHGPSPARWAQAHPGSHVLPGPQTPHCSPRRGLARRGTRGLFIHLIFSAPALAPCLPLGLQPHSRPTPPAPRLQRLMGRKVPLLQMRKLQLREVK